MSFATTVLCILFAVNLLFFLAGEPEVNSPMLAILKAFFYGGEVDWGELIKGWFTLQNLAITGVLILSVEFLSPPLVSGGFGATHVPLIFAIAIFVILFLIPNFGAIGFPFPVDMIIYLIFGFMGVLSIFGILRGE